MSKWVDVDRLLLELSDLIDEFSELDERGLHSERWCGIMDSKGVIVNAPSIDIVFCKECKHKPIKEDADGENYGFNLIEPTEGDEICPCLVNDGWYSWMPKDDFYCGYGERKESE